MNEPKSIILILVFFLTFMSFCYAQEVSWQHDFKVSEDYQTVYDKGEEILYLFTKSDSILAFDLIEKKLLSKAYVKKAYDEAEILSFERSPFYGLHELTSKENKELGRYIIISKETGEVSLDSDWFSLEKLEDIHYDIKTGSVLVKRYVEPEDEKGGKLKGLIKFKDPPIEYIAFNLYEPNNIYHLPIDTKKPKGFLKSVPDFWGDIVFDGQTIIAGIGDSLYSIDVYEQAILWKQHESMMLGSETRNYGQFDDRFWQWDKSKRLLKSLDTRTGEEKWQFDLGSSFYTFNELEDSIQMVKGEEFLLFHKIEGPQKSSSILKLDFTPEINNHELGTLLSANPDESSIRFNVVNSGSLLFDQSPLLKGRKLRYLNKQDELYYFVTDKAVGALNSLGEITYEMDLKGQVSQFEFSIEDASEFIFLNGEFLTKYSLKDSQVVFNYKISLKGDDEVANSFWTHNNNYLVASNRNLIQLNTAGDEIFQVYYKDLGMSTGLKNALLNVGSIAVGALAKDKVYDIYGDASQAGLISDEDNWDDLNTTVGFGKGGGAALLANKYAFRLVNFNNQTSKTNNLQKYWIVKDRLDSKDYGLRLISTDSGEQVGEISAGSEKQFYYAISKNLNGVFIVNESILKFYELK